MKLVLPCNSPVVELNQIACLGDQKYPSFELRVILAYLVGEGHTLWCEQLKQQLNLTNDDLEQPFIAAHQALEALSAIIDKFYRPGLGHDVACTYTIKDLGAIGTSVSHARDLEEALSITNAYYGLIGSFTDLVNIADTHTFTQRQVDVAKLDPRVMRFLFELTVSGTMTLAETLAGERIPLKSVHFACPLTASEKCLYQQVYRAEIRDKAKFNEWIIDIDCLSLPLRQSTLGPNESESSLKMLLDYLGQDQGLVDDINCILKGSAGDFPDPDMISQALGISSRTLRRRLHKLGTSYSALIDKVRCQLAINLIQHKNMSNEALAEELGYSDAANFYNAFKKWTGNSPAYYRMLEE